MFIFLSGYLTDPHVTDIRSFYCKRLSRILIPYTIWTILYCLIFRSDIRTIVFSRLTTTACYAFYYCFVYAELILITPIIGKVIDKNFSWILVLIQPTFILIIRYILNFVHMPLAFPLNDIFCCSWFTYYFMGLKMKKYNRQSNIIMWVLLVLSIVLQIAEGICWYKFGSADMATSQSKISTMLTNILLIAIACRWLNNGQSLNMNPVQKVFIKIGDCSFGIYLSHVLIMILISNKLPIYTRLPTPFKTICVFMFSFILVMIGRKIIGKKYGKYLGIY